MFRIIPQLRRSLTACPVIPRLAGILVLGCATPAMLRGAVEEGAQPKAWPANPEKHVIVLERKAGNEDEARLIAAAEAAIPPRKAVREAAGPGFAHDDEKEKLWWYKSELGVRIPFAITAEAVTYYSSLVEGYGKQALNRYVEPSSRFEYRASVKHHAEIVHGDRTFRDVHVVTLNLSFAENFAQTATEGMEFTKERVVVFDSSGKILYIGRDGPTEVPILAI